MEMWLNGERRNECCSKGCSLRNQLIEIRWPVLSSISPPASEIGPTAGGGKLFCFWVHTTQITDTVAARRDAGRAGAGEGGGTWEIVGSDKRQATSADHSISEKIHPQRSHRDLQRPSRRASTELGVAVVCRLSSAHCAVRSTRMCGLKPVAWPTSAMWSTRTRAAMAQARARVMGPRWGGGSVYSETSSVSGGGSYAHPVCFDA